MENLHLVFQAFHGPSFPRPRAEKRLFVVRLRPRGRAQVEQLRLVLRDNSVSHAPTGNLLEWGFAPCDWDRSFGSVALDTLGISGHTPGYRGEILTTRLRRFSKRCAVWATFGMTKIGQPKSACAYVRDITIRPLRRPRSLVELRTLRGDHALAHGVRRHGHIQRFGLLTFGPTHLAACTCLRGASEPEARSLYVGSTLGEAHIRSYSSGNVPNRARQQTTLNTYSS